VAQHHRLSQQQTLQVMASLGWELSSCCSTRAVQAVFPLMSG
jgi:hypothetical protein